MTGLASLLNVLAEAKELLGARLADVCIAGPSLEASVSGVALAQTEFGHSRLLHRLARRVAGDDGSEAAFLNPDREGELLATFDDWTQIIAALSVVDHALQLWLEELRTEKAGERITLAIERVLEEERFHREFARGWLEVFSADPAFHERLDQALRDAFERYARWETTVLAPAAAAASAEGHLAHDEEAVAGRVRAELTRSAAPAPGVPTVVSTPPIKER